MPARGRSVQFLELGLELQLGEHGTELVPGERAAFSRHSDQGGFHPMVVDAPTAIRLAGVIWRSLYDAGRMELIADGGTRALAHIHDFPTSPALCEANCAALSGLLGSDERPVRTEQRACVLEGAPYCEWAVSWESTPGS